MEYFIISIIVLTLSLFFALRIAKLNPRLMLLVCAISVFFQLIFDNYFTYLGLWIFDFSHTIGILLPVIPLENLLFGIALTIATVASWESLKEARGRHSA